MYVCKIKIVSGHTRICTLFHQNYYVWEADAVNTQKKHFMQICINIYEYIICID